jgi:predicted nicotinamide N-methyase
MMLDRETFIRENLAVDTAPLVPEVELYLASEITPIWRATAAELEAVGMPPPFWAFCWPGGQALARYILDNPETFRGRRVLDFAAGGGVASIALAKAGAASVTASEIDSYAIAALKLNAEINNVCFEITEADLTRMESQGWDMVIAGDVCYERPMSERVTSWLRELADAGVTVLMADPGREYAPRAGLIELASYEIPTSRELEDREMRTTVLWRMRTTT